MMLEEQVRGGTWSWFQITHVHDAGGAGERRDTVLGLANATSGTTAWLAKKKAFIK